MSDRSETKPAADEGRLDRRVMPPLQGGLTNAELTEAWRTKLPGVVPTERDLTAFALGIEVGRELWLQAAAQAAQPDDSYQDEWFKAKADSVRRIRALLPPPEREKCRHPNKVEQHFTYGYRMHCPDCGHSVDDWWD
jgi:hypothetical protein